MSIKVKLLIGRREKVSFPDLHLLGINAKVDTGAYTTALHCHEIEVRPEGGKDVLYFKNKQYKEGAYYQVTKNPYSSVKYD